MRLAARLAFLALALTPVVALGDASPTVVLATPGLEDGAIVRFTARFSQAIVPLGDPRAPSPFAVDCAVAGQGRWADQQTYIYDFAHPLPGGTSCKFDLRQNLRSVRGYAVTGASSFTVDAGGPSARAVLPASGQGEIEEDQVFLVAANMPADRASIAANAYCAVDGIGEKIAVDVLAPDLAVRLLGAMGTREWPTRSFLQNADLPDTLSAAAPDRARALAGVVALKCRRPLPPGRDMALVWSGQIAGAGGKRAGADQRFDYTVRKPFTARFECGRVNPQAGCDPVEKAYLRLTAPIAMTAATAVRLSFADGTSVAPTFSKEDATKPTTSDIAFAGPFPAATSAQLSLPGGLHDESGRPLANAERFPLEIRFDRAPPLVKFAANFGILESREGGVLPVTVRNVEPALQGQARSLDGQSLRTDGADGTVADWLRRVEKAGESASHQVKHGKTAVTINDTGAAPLLGSREGGALKIDLPGKGQAFEVVGIPLGKPGFYVVELASPVLGQALLGRNAPRYVATAALVTNMAVHFKWGHERSLAWVTALDSGTPVANAEVRVTDSCTGRLLAHGITDASGGLLIPPGLPEPQTYGGCEPGNPAPLMVSARRGDDMSFTLTSWGQGIQPYDFELPYGYSPRGQIVHTVFDRALVRQGETIDMKHIVRVPNGQGFAIPAGFTGTLRLTHRGSDTKFELPLTIDARGSGETRWTVPQGAPMGDYDLAVVRGGQPTDTGQSFKVDEYKLPTMRATVTGPREAQVRPKTMPLDLFVGYLSGGGAARLPVDVRIGWFAEDKAPEGYEAYTFGGQPLKEGVTPLNEEDGESTPQLPPTQTLPTSLRGDGTGQMTVDVPSLPGAARMQVEMDYQDANGETLTASRSIAIHPSAVQLGLKTDGWLMKQDDLRLRLVALDLDGKPIAGQRIHVALYSRQVLTARRRLIGGFYAYDNQVKVTKLAPDCSATTDAQGLAQCKLDPGVSGEVYAVATTEDARGNIALTTHSVWLAGDDEWWFGGDNGDRMDVVPEQLAYQSGDTARFQVRMPFRAATALVTVEREGVLSSFTTELSGKDPVVEVKLPGSYAPDVFVSVMAVRGRATAGIWDWIEGIGRAIGLVKAPPAAPEPTALVDLAKPSYRIGIAKIKVGWDAHRLGVTVHADRTRYGARGTAAVNVQVKQPDGRPAGSADLAFVAVDQALLQIAPNDSWDVLTAMMGERPLSVLNATAQTQVVGKRHYGRKALAPGGGGGSDMSGLNRENFQPVLLWKGHVPLDAQGRARIAVPLNDALTSFKLVAIATDGADRFGTGEADIRTAQDLTIYAGMPTLVRAGDYYTAGFTLRNGSNKAMAVTARVSTSPGIVSGNPITVTIPAGGAKGVGWNLTAPKSVNALQWHVTAASADGKARDQISVAQDIVPPVPVEIWAATLTRVGTGATLPIAPPAGFVPGYGSVDVQLANTLAPPMAGVRAFMAAYPYDCFEQQLSRAVALNDGAAWAKLAGELPTYQASDGLLRYWPSDTLDGSETLTAYVLSMSAEAGFPLPDAVKARMVEGLKGALDGRIRHETYGDPRERRVYIFAALARAGAATPAMLGQLGIGAPEMPTTLLADYLQALDHVPGLANAAALRQAGEAELRKRLVYEGTRLDLSDRSTVLWWLMSSNDEAAAKAALAVLGRPGWQEDGPKLMAGIALRQAHGHWDTTTANAWGALAVRRFASLYPVAAITGTTTLRLGNASWSRGWPLAPDQRLARLPLPGATTPLSLTQSGGAGPWATVMVRAAVPISQPVAAGYRIAKQVSVVSQRVPGRYTRGDVLRVTIAVDSAAERNWVVVSDPIPAGATIIGDQANQSQLLANQERAGNGASFGATDDQGKALELDVGEQAAYVERTREAWRGYFSWVPRGRFTVTYLMRLNGAGRFSLPATRVEAMYSPSVFALVPNAPVTIAPR